jgi:hypothetical protein
MSGNELAMSWDALITEIEATKGQEELLWMARALGIPRRELPVPERLPRSLLWEDPQWRAWGLELHIGDEGWSVIGWGPDYDEVVAAHELRFSAAATIATALLRMWSAQKEPQR